MLISQRARLIREHAYKIAQACDLEDLLIMVAQAARGESTVGLTSAFQQANNQRDPGAIDIVHLAEIQQDHLWLLTHCFIIRRVQHIFSECIHLAPQIENGNVRLVSHPGLKDTCCHSVLFLSLSSLPSRSPRKNVLLYASICSRRHKNVTACFFTGAFPLYRGESAP